MSGNKTVPTKKSVTQFLDNIENETKRKDAYVLLKLMKEITGEPAVMWGESIVGFGTYHYKYDSGREGDMLLTGFSPRKQSLTLYIMNHSKEYKKLLDKLGKHKSSKACIYINKLADVDMDVLVEMIRFSYKYYNRKMKPNKTSIAKNASSVCYENSHEVRKEYKD